MAEEVKMPQMGESIAEGTIVKWFKQVGDTVKRDEPLFEISTDKVDAEIPSPASGVLTEIKVKEGETVPVNTVVAIIDGGSAKLEAKPAQVVEARPKPEVQQPVEAKSPLEDAQKVTEPRKSIAPAKQLSVEEARRMRSSPLVRKIAAEHGIDISQVEGTGIGGRVTKNDILSYIENRRMAREAAEAARAREAVAPPAQPSVSTPPSRPLEVPEVGPPPFVEGDRVEIVPMSVMRKRIAEHMVLSLRTSAHVTTFMEVDFTETAKLRDKLKDEYLKREGVRLTYMPFIIKAIIEGIKKWPIINSSVWGDQIVYKKDINIGVAVALEWGLIVPVIRNADEKSLLGLARAVNDLSDRARSKQLKPDEVQGGTFTVTNPGVFGSLIGTPIINQPQVAILGVGQIKKRPVVINDAIAIRQIGYLSLSFDHRVIDGAVADQFMAVVRDVIESANYTS
jgi:pyruvate dehydrogenase E2 component (dihydrolipoamide acetyltransferase)